VDKYNLLKGNEIFLDKHQLEEYIENLAKQQITEKNSKRNTYPVYTLNEDFAYITDVYNLLNEHIKKGINIHPAGEWILDNYYIVEENVKMINNELTLKEYKKLPSVAQGPLEGVARIYVFASQIIKYTNNSIDKDTLENLLKIYETYQNITMDEFWHIQNFLKIAIIQNIANICEKIESSQLQKNRAIEIIDKTIENKKVKTDSRYIINNQFDAKSPFIEFMAYKLKRYGKEGVPYLNVLEEQVEKMGSNLSQIIKKEHFFIAVSRVAISNAINSIRNLSRINFQEIFERINMVEEILKQDPSGTYEKMSFETKAYYRNVIKEISDKNGISEMYIVNKALELAQMHVTNVGVGVLDDPNMNVQRSINRNARGPLPGQGVFPPRGSETHLAPRAIAPLEKSMYADVGVGVPDDPITTRQIK